MSEQCADLPLLRNHPFVISSWISSWKEELINPTAVFLASCHSSLLSFVFTSHTFLAFWEEGGKLYKDDVAESGQAFTCSRFFFGGILHVVVNGVFCLLLLCC